MSVWRPTRCPKPAGAAGQTGSGGAAQVVGSRCPLDTGAFRKEGSGRPLAASLCHPGQPGPVPSIPGLFRPPPLPGRPFCLPALVLLAALFPYLERVLKQHLSVWHLETVVLPPLGTGSALAGEAVSVSFSIPRPLDFLSVPGQTRPPGQDKGCASHRSGPRSRGPRRGRYPRLAVGVPGQMRRFLLPFQNMLTCHKVPALALTA